MLSKRIALLFISASVAIVAACSAAAIQPAPAPVAATPEERTSIESVEPYRRSGFLVGDSTVPFVGMIRYFGTETTDTALMLVALSIPPRALSFTRAGDRYTAYYGVRLEVRDG